MNEVEHFDETVSMTFEDVERIARQYESPSMPPMPNHAVARLARIAVAGHSENIALRKDVARWKHLAEDRNREIDLRTAHARSGRSGASPNASQEAET